VGRIDRALQHLRQLQAACILTMLVRVSHVGAQAGGSNSRISPRGPIQTQRKPPPSRTG